MEESQVVVNPEDANLAPDPEQEEQVEEQAEALSQPTDVKDYKAIAAQLSKDIALKNQKIQELKARTQEVQQQVEVEPDQDETVQRFIDTEARSKRAEANTEIILRLQSDPSFKDRADIVKDYVAQGYNIDMADRLAKADIMDKILTVTQTPEPIVKPKQLTPQAVPEQPAFQPSGDGFKDFMNDPNIPEAAKEATRRAFGSQL